MIRILKATVIEDYKIEISFSDGAKGVADLSSLVKSELFGKLSDKEAFSRFRIVREGRALSWDEDLELCSDSLYLKVTGKRPEDILPGFKTRV